MSRQPASYFRIPRDLQGRYQSWNPPGFGGCVDVALYEHLDAGLRARPEGLFALQSNRPMRGKRNVTVSVTLGGRVLWIKRFRPSSPVDRMMYTPGPGKAVYAWNAAMTLSEQGFCTPRPLIGLRGAGPLGGAQGIVAFEDVDDHAPLDQWLAVGAQDSEDRDALMRALGTWLRRFHDLGFRHRDLRRGNILAAADGDQWSFCLLDINRLRIQAALTSIQRMREVEKLNLPAELLPAFFTTYAPGRDSEAMAAALRDRIGYADRLERRRFGRLLRKAWYYFWELRAFGRARRP